ncbi:MAG TPA: NAD-dependent epimerase/dehydratase family protein [Trebonia sp.]|nr:NAD-dependent epimerase/dehydratase family protein [Trebonia sp.]
MASEEQSNLTVAVTGATGTLGAGLMPLLEADDRVAHVTGIARHPFDPAERGWAKTKYQRGDVRDVAMLRDAFRHADVVVHLAFQVTGAVPGQTIRSVNIDGTLNAFDAAAAAGARRFVYASSVAAYGFHRDNPIGMTEDWPTRPAARLFYAREKAELERLLRARAATAGGPALYLLRPSIVLGPHAVGAKSLPGGRLGALARVAGRRAGRMPFPVPVPELPVQLVHESDVGRALLLCAVAAGPPGAYNIAADGIVTVGMLAHELGIASFPVSPRPAQGAARAIAALPFLPPVAQWVEAACHPAIMDTAKAKKELRWVPEFTALETLRETLRQYRK